MFRYAAGPLSDLRAWLAQQGARKQQHELDGELKAAEGPSDSPPVGAKRKITTPVGKRGRKKPTPAEASPGAPTSMADVKNLVSQLRCVIEGIATVLPPWAGLEGQHTGGEPRMPGGEEYEDGTYELPAASAGACKGMPEGSGGRFISRDEVSVMANLNSEGTCAALHTLHAAQFPTVDKSAAALSAGRAAVARLDSVVPGGEGRGHADAQGTEQVC